MPLHDEKGGEVQLMISEYSLNTVLLTTVQLDIIKYINTDQSSDSIDAILADFDRSFGEHPNVTLEVKASNQDLTKYRPSIKILSTGSLIEFFIDIHIKNPIDPTIDAALIIAKAQTNMSFSVTNDFELHGFIHELKLNVIEFYPYFKTSTTIANMNTKLSILLPIMESYANSILDKGWKLPIPQNITKYILREKVEPRDGYLLIDGDVDFA